MAPLEASMEHDRGLRDPPWPTTSTRQLYLGLSTPEVYKQDDEKEKAKELAADLKKTIKTVFDQGLHRENEGFHLLSAFLNGENLPTSSSNGKVSRPVKKIHRKVLERTELDSLYIKSSANTANAADSAEIRAIWSQLEMRNKTCAKALGSYLKCIQEQAGLKSSEEKIEEDGEEEGDSLIDEDTEDAFELDDRMDDQVSEDVEFDEGDVEEGDEDESTDPEASEPNLGKNLPASSNEADVGQEDRLKHPTLDDVFFSIDNFNRQTTEEENGTRLKLPLEEEEDSAEEDDEEDEIDYYAERAGQGNDDDFDPAEMKYEDFFDPPLSGKQPFISKRLPTKSLRFASDVQEGPTEPTKAPSEEEVDHDDSIMADMQRDLLAEESDEEPQKEENKSSYEKRVEALSKEIARLEAENVADAPWRVRGEVTAKARPVNSLLEEDLDFEYAKKPVPILTEETVTNLEDKIRRRILEGQFDDVVRKRDFDARPYVASKTLALDQESSGKSLAEVYAEDERARQATGDPTMTGRGFESNQKLEKAHEEIETLWKELVHQLDSLSNFHYTPKNIQPSIVTLPQISTVVMESALPTAQSTSTLLAPEEVFDPNARPSSRKPIKGGIALARAKAETTPSEKKAARRREKNAERNFRASQAVKRPTSTRTDDSHRGGKQSVKQAKKEAGQSLAGKSGVVLLNGPKTKSKAGSRQRKEQQPLRADRLKM